MRAKINKIENKDTAERINEAKGEFFEKIQKIPKHPRLICI